MQCRSIEILWARAQLPKLLTAISALYYPDRSLKAARRIDMTTMNIAIPAPNPLICSPVDRIFYNAVGGSRNWPSRILAEGQPRGAVRRLDRGAASRCDVKVPDDVMPRLRHKSHPSVRNVKGDLPSGIQTQPIENNPAQRRRWRSRHRPLSECQGLTARTTRYPGTQAYRCAS